MTTHTKLIPPDVFQQLELARYRMRLAKSTDNPAWLAKILTEIDELLDQIGGPP